MTSFEALTDAIDELAAKWAADRPERQRRRHLERADFAALADAGYLRTMVPVEQGGMWAGVAQTARPLCTVLRTLAGADSSVALVSSMHPAVLSFWMASPDPDQPQWEAQRQAVAASALDGMQWGTVTSEPGSGGDIARTRATAEPLDAGSPAAVPDERSPALSGDRYVLNGDKHFGSGLGVTDFMFTTARPRGEDDPAAFVLDVRGLDLTAGPIAVIAEWDGAGMAATQSHAVRLHDAPATRLAWHGTLPELQLANGGFVLALFTSVVLGVVDAAVHEAERVLAPRRDTLRPFEQLEWARAETDHWVAVAAFERLLATIERGDPAERLRAGLHTKLAVAELAESVLSRLTRVIGGGAYARRSPFAHWYEDVRALGFLRPPWALAYDNLMASR